MSKDAELAVRIAPLLRKTDPVRPQAISAWRKGTNRMPADALLAACLVTGVSVDELLFGESLKSRLDRIEKRVEDLAGPPQGDRG